MQLLLSVCAGCCFCLNGKVTFRVVLVVVVAAAAVAVSSAGATDSAQKLSLGPRRPATALSRALGTRCMLARRCSSVVAVVRTVELVCGARVGRSCENEVSTPCQIKWKKTRGSHIDLAKRSDLKVGFQCHSIASLSLHHHQTHTH